MRVIRNLLKEVTKKQCMEFGQVCALAAMFFALYFKNDHYVIVAFVLLLITIIVPIILYPFAVLWFGLSKLLSAVSPAIMMGILFFLIVMPVGIFRRLLGKDTLQLKQFKKGRGSVLTDRDHLYTEDDLLHTF